ncbi:hypothetical protein ABBQ32_010785 [Trebouxia sp. C0010 RCD-2024]
MAELSAAEAAVYDRQLRVWGIEVQKRLNAAKVLIAGCTGLGAEVAKNIALAGVGSLSLMDSTLCAFADPGNFLVHADANQQSSVAEISACALQEMNPLVKVTVQQGCLDVTDMSFLDFYQVVLLVDHSLAQQQAWDSACTARGIAFYSAASRGTCAYLFANLHQHTYTPLEKASIESEEPATLEQQVIQYPSLAEALQVDWSTLHPRRSHKLICVLAASAQFERTHKRQADAADLLAVKQDVEHNIAQAPGCKIQVPDAVIEEYLCAEPLPAVNAICGGVLANELLKAVSHKGEPVNNFFFFSLSDSAGIVQRVG